MEHVDLDAVEQDPHPMGVNTARKDLAGALGAADVAIVHYDLDPGEQFSGGLHTHHDQEEIFYILVGEASFEYGPEPAPDHETGHGDGRPETEKTTVAAGEAIRFPPGQFQCGRNRSDEQVVGLAIAAPSQRHDWEALESFAPCSDCGELTSHGVRAPDDGMVVYCNSCGTELQVA